MLQASRTGGKKDTQRSFAPRACLGLQTAQTSPLYVTQEVPSDRASIRCDIAGANKVSVTETGYTPLLFVDRRTAKPTKSHGNVYD